MAFPDDVLPLSAEMLIDGTWTDITDRVRGNNDSVTIQTGYRSETSDSTTPDTATFKLNNRDFYFSNRNPSSANYGLLPQNTQVRFLLDDPAGMALNLVNGYHHGYTYSDYTPEYASTTDKAVLDVTGDIDLRIDFDCGGLPGGAKTGYQLAAKYDNSTSNRSWYWMIRQDGTMRLWWSTTGAGATNSATSTVGVPLASLAAGRIALRVTLDVNNGAAGNTARFYTSDTISGTWTQLGADVIAAGVTSIFSSTAMLTVGASQNALGQTVVFTGQKLGALRGRLYGFEMRNGIAGTLVADFDPTVRAEGDTSWSDGLGTPNTWTVTADYGRVTARSCRFWGEVAELPQKADPSGTDLYVPTTATDITRRATQGARVLKSAMTRYYSGFPNLIQWHSLETGVSTSGTTGTVGAAINAPAARYNDLTFSADEGMPGSAGVATFNSAASYLTAYTAPGTTGVPTYASFMFAFKFPSVPVSEVTMVSLGVTGVPLKRWTINCSATSFILRGYDNGLFEINSVASTFGTNVTPDKWIMMRLQVRLVATFLIAELAWNEIEDQSVQGFSSTTEFPATQLGRISGYNFAASAGLNGFKVTQVMVAQNEIPTSDRAFWGAPAAYRNEAAGARALRVAAADGLPLLVSGEPEDTATMDIETPNTTMGVLLDCARADGGLLVARTDAPALWFITRESLNLQEPLVLDHDDRLFVGDLSPVDDDAVLRNEVTLTSPGGQTGAAQKLTGPKSIAEVGRYESAYPQNVAVDQILGAAQYAVHLGTWDEIRLPSFTVDMARRIVSGDAALTAGLRELGAGGVARIDNPPAWFPPDSLELLIRGYREVMSNKVHELAFFCQNYGPFRNIAVLPGLTTRQRRVAATSSSLNTGITAGALVMLVKTPTGALWRTSAARPGNFPMDVMVGGERVTVSAISSTFSPQTFTLSARAVNGVAKTHGADAVVQVVDTAYAGY